MSVFKELLRKWRAKGHGVHSPFAYRLITNVIHCPYSYYAYSDVAQHLSKNNINPEEISEFHRLSFRLTHHFKSKTILEIGSAKGINTLFLLKAQPSASIFSIENSSENISTVKTILKNSSESVHFFSEIKSVHNRLFDAVFVDFNSDLSFDETTLFSLSHEKTFWVFNNARNKSVKPFTNNIVKDKRVRVVFDLKQTLVLFLNPDYHKTIYYI